MKYLKRFNEELNPMTYKRAARKLDNIQKESPSKGKAINATKRAEDLRQHADNIEKMEHHKKWKKEIETYKEFGEFDFIIEEGGDPESFYIALIPDLDSLAEDWEEGDPENRDIIFSFAGGIIPKNEEQYEKLTKEYDAYNGFVWAFWINIQYEVKNSEVIFKGVSMYTYEIDDLQVGNRKTANNLKKLLMSIFVDEFYPSAHNDVDNAHDKIQKEIIQGLNVSIDYGIEMETVKKDLSKLNYADFFISK
jgi:hypothetical protein